jgi:UDP-glucuronate decarboxylase
MWNILLRGKDAIYNVGGNSKTTIADLATKIGQYFDVPVIFPDNTDKAIAGAPLDVCLDMTKSKEEFDKHNFISFDEGLQKTMDWQKTLYESAK